MANNRKTITPEQFRQVVADIKSASGVNLSVADIAEGTGLSKAYISEFRNDTRNLTIAQQAQLRVFVEKQCLDHGVDFPEAEDLVSMPKLPGTLVTHSLKPSITLSDLLTADERDRILQYMDANDAAISEMWREKANTGLGGFFGGYTEETEESMRKLFGLMSANYVAFRMLIGRNIVNAVAPDFKPKTLGDVVSKMLSDSGFKDILPVPAAKVEKEVKEDANNHSGGAQ